MMSNNLLIRRCFSDDIDDIASLEKDTLASLTDISLLRANGKDSLRGCLFSPHATFGAFNGDRLVAFSILYCPGDDLGENLSQYLCESLRSYNSANFKLCIVHPEYRGNNLQVQLGKCVEQQARQQGVELLCATVSPRNAPSQKNLSLLGYTPGPNVIKYTYPRIIYYKEL